MHHCLASLPRTPSFNVEAKNWSWHLQTLVRNLPPLRGEDKLSSTLKFGAWGVGVNIHMIKIVLIFTCKLLSVTCLEVHTPAQKTGPAPKIDRTRLYVRCKFVNTSLIEFRSNPCVHAQVTPSYTQSHTPLHTHTHLHTTQRLTPQKNRPAFALCESFLLFWESKPGRDARSPCNMRWRYKFH